ncbi:MULTISPECIES: energy-coupled thiamine transporter ThiT [Aerococcus]|uniref:energy-coupled thiamine transporter ThiT n=1 Tax=Aerococcus urinae (strain CCUG 59500 / ACS-120-V-Col10a) TaxID=2976812 RepID=UPI000200F0C6|nr:energy-coupled thiamine transporter ThiT [Aerococcus sp. Group 1]AEA01648.1 putative proton-coupled thiamine transporter YuaJ [Aerococcus sp. Group 1]MCY3030139.1 energy-coupled thiamine transporter ThiT [Aerococcus sp. Group 1]MCY3061064.1 energy-coupled thiamine transporter ThiT [Aerococcus sp. Group 1]
MGQSKQVRILLEIAMVAVLAYLLGLLPTTNGVGIGVNLGVIPIYLISLRRGIKSGFAAGFLFGLLQLITGQATILTPFQVFLEYFFAFMLAGLTGLFANRVKSAGLKGDKKGLWIGIFSATFIGMVAQYFIHWFAGYAFWSSYAPEGMNAWWYTTIVNVPTGVFTWLVGALVVALLFNNAPRLLNPED